MKSILLCTLALALALCLGFTQSAAAAEPNPNDVTLQRDNERLNGDSTRMQATTIAPIIECEECKKTATGGFHNEGPKIEPQGERPAKTAPIHRNDVND